MTERPPTRSRTPRAAPRFLAAATLAAAALLGADNAAAQDDERRIERALRIADPTFRQRVDTDLDITERAQLDFGGFFTFTGLHLTDERDNSRRLLQYDTTLYATLNLDGAHTAFTRARFRYRDFSEGDSFDGRGDRWVEPFLDRYWYEFDLRRAAAAYRGRQLGWNFNVRAGRQFVDWGAGLTLSENLFAVRPSIEWAERLSLEGLAGVTPTDQSVIDFDASRDEFNRRTRRGFFGALLRYRAPRNHEFYGYFLRMQDFNNDVRPRLPIGMDVDFTYNANYLGVGSTGPISRRTRYLAEFVYQFGQSMSDPLRGPQTRENISAFAARGQVEFLLRDRRNTRLDLETIFASGDSDRNISTDTVGGNRSGTNDNAFNSLGFANTGLAFAPSLSNIFVVRAGASTFPFPEVRPLERLQIGADLFLHNKLDSNAPIDEETNNKMFLGFETDVYLNYRITSDLALNARYGAFFPGEGIAGPKHVRHFVLVSATISF